MHIILFGATGMVGRGVLRECLLDQDIHRVLAIGRSHTGQQHEKLHELVHTDFLNFSFIETQLSGFDACFFCIGVSSVGTTEGEYRHVTYKITMAAAQTLSKINPEFVFIYLSAMGADSTERGRIRWARVKGETENALLQLPFKAAYMFRPAIIQPLNGVSSKTKLYRSIYAGVGPFLPILKAFFPKYTTNDGYPKSWRPSICCFGRSGTTDIGI